MSRQVRKRGQGTLVWLDISQEWAWRGHVTIEGERVRKQHRLGTSVRSVAAAKVAKLLAGDEATASAPAAVETFSAAAERVVERQRLEGLVSWRIRLARIKRWLVPVFGQVRVDKVTRDHVRDALLRAHGEGKQKGTLMHIRSDASAVFNDLQESRLVTENVARGVRLPKDAKLDKRRRVIPTDAELLQLIACPRVSPELQVAVMFARTIGGARTSDMLAADWSHADREQWLTIEVRRTKTDTLDTHAIPEITRPLLEAWWHQSGRPERGPIFPARSGPRQGERRIAGTFTWAETLRDAFWAADVGRPMPGSPSALAGKLTPSTGLARSDCLLQTDTERTRKTGMHAIRAAYVTATHRVPLDLMQQMRLAAHTTVKSHMRYVEVEEVLRLPEGALPAISSPESLPERILKRIHPKESLSAAVGDECRQVTEPPSRSGHRRNTLEQPAFSRRRYQDSGEALEPNPVNSERCETGQRFISVDEPFWTAEALVLGLSYRVLGVVG
jgi:integrase